MVFALLLATKLSSSSHLTSHILTPTHTHTHLQLLRGAKLEKEVRVHLAAANTYQDWAHVNPSTIQDDDEDEDDDIEDDDTVSQGSALPHITVTTTTSTSSPSSSASSTPVTTKLAASSSLRTSQRLMDKRKQGYSPTQLNPSLSSSPLQCILNGFLL